MDEQLKEQLMFLKHKAVVQLDSDNLEDDDVLVMFAIISRIFTMLKNIEEYDDHRTANVISNIEHEFSRLERKYNIT